MESFLEWFTSAEVFSVSLFFGIAFIMFVGLYYDGAFDHLRDD